MIDLSVVGPVFAMGLAMIGSALGCGMAGVASHAVMSRIDEGHGKIIGLSAMPSSQSIYGLIFMLLLRDGIKDGKVSAIGGIAVGLSVGVALLISAVMQGKCCVSAIQAYARSSAIYGKSFASIGIVESFALFAFVFALLLF
ncbi:ATP synthase subunit C [Chlamydia abortus]|uniref:V-type sodium ATP synthase subunit K n=1 Tax=Chlamydia abortus (strain DSM 27085 / S26/3) TaxID=218497 RepID=Q5L5J4_CHLAB|nr:ATP synthase subunit C [Chlamydia abortus]ASD30774.1 V-type ATP synthase subunit K [Chlamydia abortus]AUS60128.1 V-type ATP synthase subunit k [Chlamydia abortus]EGK69390.1 V-type ATP synthase subunit K [Chlamydia abortus LLG]QEM73995.1 ATP synthase subunit C [Chlamydia abortus]QRR31415.1 ATP synthase subunit C [Chlamydia abortus]